MPGEEDRRIADAAWKARMEVLQDTQIKTLNRIEAQCATTNGRVTSLELSRSRNAWLIRAAGAVGLAGAIKAFTAAGVHDVLPK